MDKVREAFEEMCKDISLPAEMYEFDEAQNRFISKTTSCLWMGFSKAWQFQQAEIDELEKRIESAMSKLESLHDEKWAEWKEQADMYSQGGANAYEHAMSILEGALRGEYE